MSKMNTIEKYVSFFVKLFILLCFFGLFALVINEIYQEEIVLEPLSVPEDLIKDGYSGEVVAEKLLDEVRRIELDIRDFPNSIFIRDMSGFYNTASFKTDTQFTDIQIPGTNFTYRSLIRYFRAILGIRNVHLRGNIIFSEDKIILTLRNISDNNVPHVVVSIDSNNLEELIKKKGGEALIKISNPILLVTREFYQYYQVRSNTTEEYAPFLEKLEEIVNYCLKYSPTNVDLFALTLLAYAYVPDVDEKSILYFQSILKIDNSYLAAYLGLIEAYSRFDGRTKDAERIFDKALKANPKDFETIHLAMSSFYARQGAYEKSVQMFENTAERTPDSKETYLAWGMALNILEQYEEAIDKFRKALQLDFSNATIYFHLGESLFALQEYEEAIEMFRQAGIFNPSFGAVIHRRIYDSKRMINKCDDKQLQKIKEEGYFTTGCVALEPTSN